MGNKIVPVNHDLLEQIQYENAAFPVSRHIGHFDDYLNKEFNHHWHEELECAFVLEGEAEYRIHQYRNQYEWKLLKKGDGAFINSRALHRARQTKPGTVVFDVVFPPGFFNFQPLSTIYRRNVLPIIQSPLSGLFFSANCHEDRDMLNDFYEFYTLSSDAPDYELQCTELICRICRRLFARIEKMECSPPPGKSDQIQEQRIRLMLTFIHSFYSSHLNVEQIAESASIGRSECFRIFKKIIGKTPVEYLTEYRLAQAAYHLSNTEKSISEICFSCGFNSTSYFGKIFKDNCGMSPSQYRRSIRSAQKR